MMKTDGVIKSYSNIDPRYKSRKQALLANFRRNRRIARRNRVRKICISK